MKNFKKQKALEKWAKLNKQKKNKESMRDDLTEDDLDCYINFL